MSRSLVLNLLASALTILSTIAFLAATLVVGIGTPPTAPDESGHEAIVYRFYDAINAVLRTGDPADLEVVVAPDFTLRGAGVAVSPDRAGLIHQLVATSAVVPGLHLKIDEVAVAGDLAVVRVTQARGTTITFLGVPFATTPAFWGQFNVLRFAGGRVTELWSGEESVPLLEPLRQARLDPLLTSDQRVMFRQLSADAGQGWTAASTFQSRVLYVEAGALTVEVDPASLEPAVLFAAGEGRRQGRLVSPGARAMVREGETLALSPVDLYELRDAAVQPDLRAYEVAFSRFLGTGPVFPGLAGSPVVEPPPPSESPTWDLLVDSVRSDLPQAALSISFGRLILPPGRSLALAEAPGSMLLTVEAGLLECDAQQADLLPVTTMVGPGDATMVPRGEVSTLRAVGAEPVVVFVIANLPVHAGAGLVPLSPAANSGR